MALKHCEAKRTWACCSRWYVALNWARCRAAASQSCKKGRLCAKSINYSLSLSLSPSLLVFLFSSSLLFCFCFPLVFLLFLLGSFLSPFYASFRSISIPFFSSTLFFPGLFRSPCFRFLQYFFSFHGPESWHDIASWLHFIKKYNVRKVGSSSVFLSLDTKFVSDSNNIVVCPRDHGPLLMLLLIIFS